jgi:SAM-dependent methyltransferase
VDLEYCTVCGAGEFRQVKVLWPELIAEWELSPGEAEYIDQQQGFLCAACGSNLRSMTLAHAIMRACGFDGLFDAFCRESDVSREWSLLEINRAGSLTPFLANFRHYRLAEYPALDMQSMSGIAGESVDIVVHSDTLEHLPDPVRALEECRRILTARGFLAYTVPVIAGRLTRRRDALPPSFHGDPADPRPDIRVVSEYGADFWTQPMQAGFRHIELHALAFPQSVATIARK